MKISKNLFFYLAILIAVCFAALFRLTFPTSLSRTPDERVYTSYASDIAVHGIGYTRALVKHYNERPSQWRYPTPIRIAYIYPMAILMRIFQNYSIDFLAYTTRFISLLSIILMVWIGVRFLDRRSLILTLLFMSVSSMDLALVPRAWQDSFFAFTALLLIYITCELSLNYRKIWLYLFLFVGSFLPLVKESGVIVLGICVLWEIGIVAFREKARGKLFFFISSIAVACLGSFFTLALLSGGIKEVVEVIYHSLGSVSGNSYALGFCSGPWHYYIQALFLLTPLCTLAFFLGAMMLFSRGKTFFSGKTDKAFLTNLFLGIFSLTFLALAMIPPHQKDMRYLSPIYASFYFTAANGMIWSYDAIATKLALFPRRIFSLIASVIILIFLVMDFRNFKSIGLWGNNTTLPVIKRGTIYRFH